MDHFRFSEIKKLLSWLNFQPFRESSLQVGRGNLKYKDNMVSDHILSKCSILSFNNFTDVCINVSLIVLIDLLSSLVMFLRACIAGVDSPEQH